MMQERPPRISFSRACAAIIAATALCGTGASAQERTLSVTWDPSPDLQAIGYVVYVGTEPGVYSEQYDAGKATSFQYTAWSASSYFFAVAAYAAPHQIGPRSAEVSSIQGTSLADLLGAREPRASELAADSNAFAVPARLCDGIPRRCLQVSRWTETTAVIDALAATPDGRVFAVENGTQIRVATDAGWASAPALVVETPGESLERVVVDPAFATTRRLFVSHVRTRPDATRELSIIRYREVASRLGEPAAVVSGLELPPGGRAQFTVDGLGRLYIAMPGAEGGRDPYAATVLRFEGDGTVPSGSRGSSPIFAAGVTRPSGLVWDSQGNRLWLTGADVAGSLLAHLSLADAGGAEWPKVPDVSRLGTVATPVGVAVSAAMSAPPSETYALAMPDALYLRSSRATHVFHSFGDVGEITALTGSANGVMHTVVRLPGQSGPSLLLELRPETP